MSTKNEHSTARQLIFTQLQAAFAAAGITTGVEWPNLRFQQPDSGAWYRVTLGPGETNPAALGASKLNRTPFVVIVQCFLPQESTTGTQAAFDLADQLGDYLNYGTPSQTDGPTGTTAHVKFRTVSQPSFVQKEGNFEQYNITLPGHYDVEPGTSV